MDKAVSHRKKGLGQSFMGSVLFSLFLTFLLLIAALLVASFLSLRVKDPAALIPLFGNGASLFGALFCGFLSARLRGRHCFIVRLSSADGTDLSSRSLRSRSCKKIFPSSYLRSA